MLIEDLYSYNHKLVKTPILLKSLYVIPAFILTIMSNEVAFHLGVFVIFFFGILIVVKPPLSKLLKLFLIPGVFILLGCLTLLFSFQKGVNLFDVVTINEETYSVAIAIFFRSYALISIVYFWLLTHTISEIAASMYACKIPSLFVELFVLTYKLIYMLMHTIKTMFITQKCRMGYGSVRKNSIDTFAFLFSAVFKKSMQQTEQLEIAMASRLGNNKYVFVRSNESLKNNKIMESIIFNIMLLTFFIIFGV